MELSFPVQGLLSSSQTASILEAGLTYVLYQRGQIPLPYQQLQMSASQHKKLEEAGIAAGQKSGDSSCYGGETPQLNPRERISSMLLERKKRLLSSKLERQKRQALELESKAYNSIQSALEVLQKVLSDVSMKSLGVTCSGHSKKVLSMALVLGPSVYSPKEVYSFDLPFPYVPNESTLISRVATDQFEKRVLRQFYKKVITCGDLMDFTSKPLPKTYAHICLVTLGDLNSILQGNSSYKEIVRLPTLPPILHQIINSPANVGSEDTEPSLSPRSHSVGFTSRKSKPNKCFKFKIHYDGPSNAAVEESIDSIDITQSSSSSNSAENSKVGSFSGDILFDNNSFSCYQIPLRFKGVQCKNKRL